MNVYAEAIDIITSNIDFRTVLIEVAKKNPGVVVAAANRLKLTLEPVWKHECRELMETGQKLQAIKHARNNNLGMSLGEAKELVESL